MYTLKTLNIGTECIGANRVDIHQTAPFKEQSDEVLHCFKFGIPFSDTQPFLVNKYQLVLI